MLDAIPAEESDEPLLDLTWASEVFDDLKEGRSVDPTIEDHFSANGGLRKVDLKAAIRFEDLITPNPSEAPQRRRSSGWRRPATPAHGGH